MDIPRSVLIADDSLFMRTTLKRIINDDPRFTVIGLAQDGLEAVELAAALKPEVITIDLQMPKMDGVTAIQQILERDSIPILVVSSIARAGQDVTMQALENGAIDFLLKPGTEFAGLNPEDRTFVEFRKELLQKLDICSRARVRRFSRLPPAARLGKIFGTKSPNYKVSAEKKIVVVGCSTGGPPAMIQMLSRFPADFAYPVVVVQHMQGGFTKSLATRISRICSLAAREAEDREKIKGGTVYITPGDRNLEIIHSHAGDIVFRLTPFAPGQVYKPSINLLFNSAAGVYGANVRACLLTGMGDDGVDGMVRIIEYGGRNFVQSERTCAVFGMPGAAIQRGVHHGICDPEEFFPALMTSFETT